MSEISEEIISAIKCHKDGNQSIKDFLIELLIFEKKNDDKNHFSFKPEITEMINRKIDKENK